MGYLIPFIIIICAVAGIVYIVTRRTRVFARKEVSGLIFPDFEKSELSTRGQEHGKKEYLDFLKVFNVKEDATFLIFVEKLIRRMRVRLMRIENLLTKLANSLREKTQKKSRPDGPRSGASLISLNTQDEKSAEQYWLGICKQEPESTYPYKQLGEIYAARADFHEARSVLKHALELDPTDEDARTMVEKLKGKKTKRARVAQR